MSATPEIPVLLRTAPRDVRATRGELQAKRLSLHVRAAEFAQAIFARFINRAWPWSPQSLVLKKDRPAVAVQYLQQHTHTHLAPRLDLTVLAWPAGRDSALSDAPSLPAARIRVEQETHVLRTIIQPVKSWAPERLAYRVVAQNGRVEAGPTTRATPPNQSLFAERGSRTISPASIPGVAPVPRVVRHVALAETEPAALTRSAASARLEEREASRAANAAPHPPNPVLDLNQLTDRVIQAIDQRIIAQRERLGRT